MQIIILGMHRSGTSAVSRLINMMGTYLGPEEKRMAAQPDNPKGFWERSDVMRLNNEILHAAGGSWDQVSQINLKSISGPDKEQFGGRISDILLEMDAHRPWSLKDPRMCLTLPVWRSHLEIPVFLFVFRNPVQVAQSLAKRNNLPLFIGIALWEYYTVKALNGIKGEKVIFIRYEDVMSDPVEATASIYKNLKECGVNGLKMPDQKEIEAFISADLFHHKDNNEVFDEYLNVNQLNLVQFLQENPDIRRLSTLKVSAGSLEALNSYSLQILQSKGLKALENEKNDIHSELKQLHLDLNTAATEISRLRSAFTEHEKVVKDQKLLLSAQAKTVAHMKEQLSEKEMALVEISAKNDAQSKRIEILEREKDEIKLKQKRAQADLRSAIAEVARLNQILQQKEGVIRDKETRQEAIQKEVVHLKDQLSEKKIALAEILTTCKEQNNQINYIRKEKVEKALAAAIQIEKKTKTSAVSLEGDHTQIREELITLKSIFNELIHQSKSKDEIIFGNVQKIEEKLFLLLSNERQKFIGNYRKTMPSRFLLRLAGCVIHPRRTFSYFHDRKIVLNSQYFDENYYLQNNHDVLLNYADPVEHFCLYGWKEGRNPHPSFDVGFYLSNNPDVAQAKVNPLVHFEKYGRAEGRKISDPVRIRDIGSSVLKERGIRYQPNLHIIAKGTSGRIVPAAKGKPVISIVVSAYNHWEVTANCLASIVDHTDFEKTPYEIILADDCSTDQTKSAAKIFPGLKIVRTKKNLGYLLNTNNAASQASGEYIILLNNDTIVQKKWLKELIEIFLMHPNAGVVGSLLCDQNGITMDSGNLIKSDGTGDCWGRGFSPDHPSFSYVRRCHYVTAACLMIKKELWDEIGGFDARFAPSYCEDADLGMEVRNRGYEVLIQPFSRVIHLENVSQGASAKEQISIRTEIFRKKWADELVDYPDSMGNAFMDKDLSPRQQTIVVMEGWVPIWDTNAGARSFLMLIQLKRRMGYNVKLVFYYDYPKQYREYISKYQRMGFEVWHSSISDIGWKEWMFTRRYAIDAVMIHRPKVADITLEWVKNTLKKPVIYFNHDLHFLRMQRENLCDKSLYSDKQIATMKRKEMEILSAADVSLTPSLHEVEYCRRHFGLNNCFFMPLFIYDAEKTETSPNKFFDGKTIIFVAGFDHNPNVQGGIWFLENIWPIVKRECKESELHIVGSNPPPELMNFNQKNDVSVHGYVTDEELRRLYAKSHVAVIPLLAGAGLKGKLLEAMFYGVPVVGTAIAFEGCPGIHKVAAPADTPDDFSGRILELLNSPEECRRKQAAGYEIIRKYFSETAGMRTLQDYINQALSICPAPNELERRKRLKEDKTLVLSCNHFDKDQYVSSNPKVFYTGMRPEDFYFFYEKHNITFDHVAAGKKNALVISPVSTEFGQGNSLLIKNLTQKIADMGYVIHFLYYPSDNSEFLNNQKAMPWDYVYKVEDQHGVLLKLKYGKNGNPLPDAHMIDDWCGPELIGKVKELSARIKFDLCLCNYVWLSKTLEYLPAETIKLIETHDKFSHRDSDEYVLAGKNHSGWFSTVPDEEKKGLARADYVLAVQEEDARFFSTLVDEKKVVVVGTGLPEQYMDIKPFGEKLVIGYIAGVNGFNIDQIKGFYDAWERRSELTKKTELYIAGSIGKWLNRNNPLPKARVHGFIENIADFYSECDVIINPDFGGTGIKIKCLEALSYGKPLICSERSMNGIASDNVFHRAKNLDEMLDLLRVLSLNPDEIRRQVDTSIEIYKRYVKTNDFETILKKWNYKS